MYGNIIKKIRKAKGFSQKEVYANVVSKTFYSDFEADKYSISIEKFEGLLRNLGISYAEFEYFKTQNEPDEVQLLNRQIDQYYSQGKFDALQKLYEQHDTNHIRDFRYAATRAYLLVLLKNRNYYTLSRTPFIELIAELTNAKMWTLKEVKLAKLVLLSFSEKDKEQADSLFKRIADELLKYKDIDPDLYYEETGDLFFNRIQSLLVNFEFQRAFSLLDDYTHMIGQSDKLDLLIQLEFITLLVRLYQDFPATQERMELFLSQFKNIPASETRFYEIIYNIHKEKAKSYS